MAKNAITDYDTDPANNTDVGNIGTLGTNIPSNFDNSQREIMSHLAKMNAGTSPLHDTFTLSDPDDATKQFRFDGVNITTGQKRIITVPDKNVDLGTINSLVGQVGYFATSAAPTGYLKADGSAISRTTYADLFAVIGATFGTGDGSTTFNLPDLRGEFIRGFDDSRGVDSGRVFGTSQLDAFQGHNREIGVKNQIAGSGTLNYGGGSVGGLVDTNNVSSLTSSFATAGYGADTGYGTPRVATETRSRNIALLACIKY